MFDDGSELPGSDVPESFPESFPAGVLRINTAAQTQESNPNTPAGKLSGSRLDDPAYVLTVDGLTELWIETSRKYVGNGQKRDKVKAIKPMVQETLDCGISPEEIAPAMRTRRNKMEWYDTFHTRLLAAKEKHHADSSNRSAGWDAFVAEAHKDADGG